MKAAVSGIRSQLTADQASLEGSLAAMESDADGSLATLAANEGAATTAAAAAQAALRAGGERLGAALAASVARGGELQGAAASAAAEAGAKLEAHSSALSAAVTSQTAALAMLASEQAAACSGAVSAAGNARAALQEAAAAGLAADGTAGDRLDELTQAGAAAVAAFAGEQTAELAQLSGLVQQRINEEYRSDTNRGELSGVGGGRSVLVGNTAALVQLAPAHELHPCTSFHQLDWLADVIGYHVLLRAPPRPADKVPTERERPVPAAAEIQALRAPPVDAVFAEFRAQLAPAAGSWMLGG